MNEKLIEFAFKGQVAVVRELLHRGADVNARNCYGDTALLFAAKGEHKTIMQILQAAGAQQ